MSLDIDLRINRWETGALIAWIIGNVILYYAAIHNTHYSLPFIPFETALKHALFANFSDSFRIYNGVFMMFFGLWRILYRQESLKLYFAIIMGFGFIMNAGHFAYTLELLK